VARLTELEFFGDRSPDLALVALPAGVAAALGVVCARTLKQVANTIKTTADSILVFIP